MSLPRPLYRTRQFLGALRPAVAEAELAETERFLGRQLFALFRSMTLLDQRHSMDVYQLLRDQRSTDRDILSAALLHDVGKGRIRLWERIAYVLADTVARPLLPRFSGGLARLRDHATLGAERLAAAGASPELVRLVAEHERRRIPSSDLPLHLLRAADDAC